MFGVRKKKFSVAIAILYILCICSLMNLYIFHLDPFIETITGLLSNRVVPVVVPYRNAPWKPEIGRWLSSCDANVTSVEIIEAIWDKPCKDGCNKHGNCNYELGHCRCFHGFTGEDCSEKMEFECNHPSSSDQEPYGRWVVSICPAHCDKSRSLCFCGEGTKYPNRAVPEECGFQQRTLPDGRRFTDWGKRDENIFTTNGSLKGWCNVDPIEAYESRVNFKEECDCRRYDGFRGKFCEITVQSVCINQCSNHGICRGGFCQCRDGWYGMDCSVPSISSYNLEWPKWLVPLKVNTIQGNSIIASSTVLKKRPLIYVYDLPPEFNALLLEGRHHKGRSVNRIYDAENRTEWTAQAYSSQISIYESMLASQHRTLNGDEADYFFVPVFDSWMIPLVDENPYLGKANGNHKSRAHYTSALYKKAYDHIVAQYPHWNKSSGRDHIWMFAWDEGACMAPKELWNGVMLVHWGNTHTKHVNSTTAYDDDNWDSIPEDLRGNHSCFDPIKDIILPAWKIPDSIAFKSKPWDKPREDRKTLFYFNGNLGPLYNGRPQNSYSMGLRQRIGEEFGSTPNKEGQLGKQREDDVIVLSKSSHTYGEELSNSTFCGVFPGDGWSARMEDSVLHGCIPVIIQDGIYLPYENVFNLDSFGVRISEDDIPNMIRILRNISDAEIETKQSNVRKIIPRFLYRDSIMLEAARQKRLHDDVEDWAVQFSQLDGDDVFATLMQILHYKLHNDKWRKEFLYQKKKKFGVPPNCQADTKPE